jgi:hypothetical protein
MYGGDKGERAPRRRRRRPDDTTDTGAHTIIERVNSESAKLQPIREDTPPPSRTSHRQQRPASHHKPEPQQRPAPPPRAAQPPPRQPAPEPPQLDSAALPPQFREPSRPARAHDERGWAGGPPEESFSPGAGRRPSDDGAGSGPSPQSNTAMRPVQPPPSRTDLPRIDQRSGPRPAPAPQPPQPPMGNPEPPRPAPQPPPQPRRRPAPPPQSMPSGTFPAPPPVDAEDLRPTTTMSPIGNGLAPEDVTEQLPRINQPTGQHPSQFPPARANFGPAQAPSAPERNGYPDEFADLDHPDDDRGRGVATDYPDYPDGDDLDDFEAEGYDDGEPDEDGPRSPGREWLTMAGQVAVSVIGGAGVWLGFNWLWGKLPQAALVAALAVIVGLVWIVRKIRRADDLQTTGLAVLVGLFVTVSPAALLLLSR